MSRRETDILTGFRRNTDIFYKVNSYSVFRILQKMEERVILDIYPRDFIMDRKHYSLFNVYFRTTKWEALDGRYNVVFDIRGLDMHKLFMTFVFWTPMTENTHIWRYFVDQIRNIYKSYPSQYRRTVLEGSEDPWYWICTHHKLLEPPNSFQLAYAVLFLAQNLPRDSAEYFNLTHEPLKSFLGANGPYRRFEVFNHHHKGTWDQIIHEYNRLCRGVLSYIVHIPGALTRRSNMELIGHHEEVKVSTDNKDELNLLDFDSPLVEDTSPKGAETEQRDFCCTICMERPIDARLDPCGHLFCKECTKRTENCFVCRTLIERVDNCFIP